MRPDQRFGTPISEGEAEKPKSEMKKLEDAIKAARQRVAQSERFVVALEQKQSQGVDVVSNGTLAATVREKKKREQVLSELEQRVPLEKVREEIKDSGLPPIAEDVPLTIPDKITPQDIDKIFDDIDAVEKRIRPTLEESGFRTLFVGRRDKGFTERARKYWTTEEARGVLERIEADRTSLRDLTMKMEIYGEWSRGEGGIQGGTQEDLERRILSLDQEMAEMKKMVGIQDLETRLRKSRRIRNRLLGFPMDFLTEKDIQ